MKICCLGSYEENYPRNSIIRKGLVKNGVCIKECNVSFSLGLRFWNRYIQLVRKHWSLVRDYDILFVPEMNHLNMPLAYVLAKIYGKPLIFDPFISMYNTNVEDRKRIRARSISASFQYYLDKCSLLGSNLVIADTEEHRLYFHRTFGTSLKKIKTVYVGVDDSIFFPKNYPSDQRLFTVCFFGTYVPLQGIEYILGAAKLLTRYDEIGFKLIGDGQMYKEMRQIAVSQDIRNVTFLPRVPLSELPVEPSRSDVCLGIFGGTDKARRVIPNKVFQAMALKKPVLTGDSPAIREIFSDRRHLVLCKMASSESLAETIVYLKENKEVRDYIAEEGYKLVKERYSPRAIGRELKRVLEDFMDGGS